jgi:hypothetical protein
MHRARLRHSLGLHDDACTPGMLTFPGESVLPLILMADVIIADNDDSPGS